MSSLFDETEGHNVVKSGITLVFLDGLHRRIAVHMLLDDVSYRWTDNHLRVNLTMHEQGAAILQAEAVKLAKVAST